MMRYKGIVESNSMIHVLEPRTINGRTHFKIVDEGNLKYFPVGSGVYFELVRTSEKNSKYATITGKVDMETAPSVAPLENVLPFPEKASAPLISPDLGALHFYIVFNPMFNNKIEEEMEGVTQAHSFYHLLENRSESDPDAHLYWGKLRSSGGHDPLVMENFSQVLERNNSMGQATHLYISDFHFFWVARVSEVCFHLDREVHGKNTLNFYRKNWDRIEAWFKIVDMEILSNNPQETNDLIGKLSIRSGNALNTRQASTEDIQITPYLSGLRYPLIIEDQRGESYFEFAGNSKALSRRSPLIEHSLSETHNTKKIIYSYVIPERVFQRFSHQVQDEILSAEMDLLRCEGGTKKDIQITAAKVARSYLIALERCIADVVKNTNPPSSSEFYGCDDFSLGKFSRLLVESNLSYLRLNRKELYDFFLSLKGSLFKLAQIRNDIIHQHTLEHEIESLQNVRRIILGVGTGGMIMKLYFAAYPELKDLHDIRLPREKKVG